MAALSAWFMSPESTIEERESLVTQLCDEQSLLQTQAASIQTAVAACADTSAGGRVHQLEMNLPSARPDLRAEQAEQRSLRAKESELLDIRNGLEG